MNWSAIISLLPPVTFNIGNWRFAIKSIKNLYYITCHQLPLFFLSLTMHLVLALMKPSFLSKNSSPIFRHCRIEKKRILFSFLFFYRHMSIASKVCFLLLILFFTIFFCSFKNIPFGTQYHFFLILCQFPRGTHRNFQKLTEKFLAW